MSDIETATATATAAAKGDKGDKGDAIPQQDAEFIMTCIKNATGGVLTVDAAKIAAQLGFINPRSVTNKISNIKKKYGLAISTAGGSKAGSSSAGGDGAALAPFIAKTPAPPRTPKGKVTKAKATPKSSAKKAPVKKAPNSPVKAEADGESEDAEANEAMEDAKESQSEDA
ncbi:hypothetical protein IFR05_015731 [Cadophora sp. M221]|nr:hypothetical protein IFR05_015731 [Cadophora sp. M221]